MNNTLSKYSSLAIVVFPVLSCYAIGDILLYKFLMLFSCIYVLFTSHRIFYTNKQLVVFYLYAFTIPIINAIFQGALSHLAGSILTPLLFGMTLCLLLPHIDLALLKKYYHYIVVVAIIVFFLQELSFLLLGTRFCALIPFLDLPGSDTIKSHAAFVRTLDRSCSIFKEPSHFAQYLAPYFALALDDLHSKHRLINLKVIIITIVYILLRSGNGILLCGVLWIFSIIFSNIGKLKKYLIIIPFSVIVAYFGYNTIINTEMGEEMLERTSQLQSDQDRLSSGYIRIYRGFMVYGDMNTVSKIVGIGPGGANDMIERSSFSWMFGETERYLNNASAFLISFGVIGTMLFVFFLIKQCEKRRFSTVLIFSAFILLSLMEGFFFDPRMLLYIGLLCVLNNDSVEKKEFVLLEG